MTATRRSPTHDRSALTLVPLFVGLLAFSLSQTSVVPSLTQLGEQFDASPTSVGWVITAYFLVASVATPVLGRLGDMFGKRRLLALALAAFAAGSLVAALADTLPQVIAGRALQGICGGAVPLSFAIVRDELPPARVPTSIALLGATTGVGGAIGLPVGGLLTDGPGFQWIFWLSAATSALATVSTLLFVRESPLRSPGRVDLVGIALLSAGLTGVLLAISYAGTWGWAAPRTLALGAAGLVVLAAFAAFERPHPAPLVNLRTLASTVVLRTNASTILLGVGLFGSIVLVPQLAQLPVAAGGLGADATTAGLLMAPSGLLMLVSSASAGPLGMRFGFHRALALGALLAAAGLLAIGLIHDTGLQLVAGTCVMAAGIGIAFSAAPNLIIGAVEPQETGEATGLNAIMRTIGSALGVQIGATIVASQALGDEAFTTALAVGAAGTVTAALVALTIPAARRPPSRATATATALANEPLDGR